MKNDSQIKGPLLILKVIASVYLVVFDVYMFREYFFVRGDSSSRTIAIVCGILILVVAIFFIVSSINGISDARSQAKRNNVFNFSEGVVARGNDTVTHHPQKKQHKKKKRK